MRELGRRPAQSPQPRTTLYPAARVLQALAAGIEMQPAGAGSRLTSCIAISAFRQK
jgi:hypothetical protein